MPIDVCFVLPPDLVLLDFAGPAEAFRIAAAHGGEFRVRVAAAEAAATTSIGVTLGRIEPLPATLRAEDLLIVCGSTHDAAALASKPGRALVRWLREVGTVPKRFACVCAGALFAARAGLLDGKRCTTHHLNIEALRAEAPAAQVLDSRVFVEDRGFYTSAGITAGIDLALHLIAELASPQLSVEVARHMVVYLRRAPDDAALSPWLEGRNHMDPGIHRAQDALARAAHEDWPLPRLAARAHVSVRTLTRHFRDATGMSVREYHARLRFAVAKQALATGVSVESAATMAGLGSARQLRRLWLEQAGTTPRG
ncbi:MAG: DJ-1/PfpI family protein [Rudaea sp.]|uniref:GlxA family transcriptional regulator n=1 Tax=unclassified Rudaea TaxID=2627037 RepID=UPI0010FA32C2|nr:MULTISPECIES: helix-turn-helix domain-containing protein [unclassified Rudaea]MBN8888078.1 DJ-1/PfpI family protein [Rudaea sp.]